MTARILKRARFIRKLKKLPPVARRLIRRAIEQSADEMVALMKSLVPKDTLLLRDSIDWTWGKPPAGTIVLAEIIPTDETLTATIFAGAPLNRAGRKGAFYGRWQEFGTVHFPANPYFFVSYRALRSRSRRRISRSITRAAKTVART